GETANPRARADLPPESGCMMTLHDNAVELKESEIEMIMAYRRASDYDRGRIDMVLDEYKKGTASDVG
ncbi:MAG: hypothetical protein IJV43_01445, partial [Oscillospiraceae bacterium]|nr:hypothetical protein [Oscillospiraceae bacterium]